MYFGRIFTFLLTLTVANAFGPLWRLKKFRLHIKRVLPLLAVHSLGKPKVLPIVLPLPLPLHHQHTLTRENTVHKHGCNKWKPYFHRKPFHLGHHHYLDDLYSHHGADLDGCYDDDHHYHQHHHHHHHHNEYRTHKTVFLPSFPHHHYHHPNIDYLSHHNEKWGSDTYLHPSISRPPEKMMKTETYQRPSVVILPKKKVTPDDEFVNIRDWRPRGKEIRFVKKPSSPRLLYKLRPQKKTIILVEKNEDKYDNEDEDDEIVSIRDWKSLGKKVHLGEKMKTRKKAVVSLEDDEDDEENEEEEKAVIKRKNENSGKRRNYT